MLIRKIYERKRLYEKIYDCIVSFGQSTRKVKGFLDSGNLVKKGNLPVCFLASDIFYQLVPVEFLEERVGQVCDEIQFMTMAGEKKTKVYEGEIYVEGRKKRVYYAPSVHMIGREYDVILHGEIMEDRE